jgi:phosphate transport system permease protein
LGIPRVQVPLVTRRLVDRTAKYVVLASATTSFLILAAIALFTVKEGMPAFREIGLTDFLFGTTWRPNVGKFGILPMMVGSVLVTLHAMVLAVPLGVACAILLAEVAPAWLRRLLRPAVELLVGIPSVVYGLVGMLLIVPRIRQISDGSGFCVAAAAIVLMAMVLPTVVTISEDSIRAVPKAYKEAALAMGATHWQTIWHVLLPAARRGIAAGVILGMGRAIGETMAMILVIGNSARIPLWPFDSARTLTGNIAVEINYATGVHESALFATGVVLFVVIVVLNSFCVFVLRRGIRAETAA